MSPPLVLYGASELGRDTLSVLHALEEAGRRREVLGFVDDEAARHGSVVGGLPVLGGGDWLDGRAGEVEVLLTVGDPRVRRRLDRRLTAAGHRWATLIHPTAVTGPEVRVEEGALVMALTSITVDAAVGRHVVVNPGCTLAHDVRVEEYAYLSPGVDLAGRVIVGAGAFLGTGAVVLPSVRIGRGALLGAGAVATKDVEDDRVAVGNPARAIRRTDQPWEDA